MPGGVRFYWPYSIPSELIEKASTSVLNCCTTCHFLCLLSLSLSLSLSVCVLCGQSSRTMRSLQTMQETHGPYRSPETQFPSINTYLQSLHNDNTISLIEWKKNFLRINWSLIVKLLNFVNVFRYFVIIAPWERCVVLPFNKQIPFIIECFVSSFVENSPVVLEKKMKMWQVYRQMDIYG